MISLRRLRSRRQNVLALGILIAFAGMAVFAPVIAPPDDPGQPAGFRRVGGSTDPLPRPPSADAVLGTASGQFDIFHTLVWGTRGALRFGLVTAMATACLGVIIGATSGYLSNTSGGLAMRFTDAFLTFPPIAGIWLLRTVLLPPDVETPPTAFQTFLMDAQLDPTTLALIAFSWMAYARLMHTNVARLKHADFVQAAQALGASHRRVLFRHLLPNAISPAIVLVARDVGSMVVLESALTIIGLGGITEWGTLLAANRAYIIGSAGNPLRYWWVFVPISLALILFGIGWNLLGDALNTVLNPKSDRG
ncbi:MAG TPA: ABC transporter permease [Anaerolineae bacterium]|nr:ABC transporter permease [Anaerolineae bacterium]